MSLAVVVILVWFGAAILLALVWSLYRWWSREVLRSLSDREVASGLRLATEVKATPRRPPVESP